MQWRFWDAEGYLVALYCKFTAESYSCGEGICENRLTFNWWSYQQNWVSSISRSTQTTLHSQTDVLKIWPGQGAWSSLGKFCSHPVWSPCNIWLLCGRMLEIPKIWGCWNPTALRWRSCHLPDHVETRPCHIYHHTEFGRLRSNRMVDASWVPAAWHEDGCPTLPHLCKLCYHAEFSKCNFQFLLYYVRSKAGDEVCRGPKKQKGRKWELKHKT